VLGSVLACAREAPPGQGAPVDSAAAAAADAEMDPQAQFWNNLLTMCDTAYAGRVMEAPMGDTIYADRPLVIHVRMCSSEEIQIPFHVGDDHSRTWVLTRDELGMRLKHDIRRADGAEEPLSMYGGDTRGAGEATAQEFPANPYTIELIPVLATSVWTIEIVPGQRFVYAGSDSENNVYRFEFDLTKPVAEPPPPWGGGS
jgi:hypothetical protein